MRQVEDVNRLPLTVPIETRDGSLTKDALTRNAFFEKTVDGFTLCKRPALSLSQNLGATGQAQGALEWSAYSPGAALFVWQDHLFDTASGVSHALTVLTANQPFSMVAIPPISPANAKAFFQNGRNAFIYDGTTVTAITDPDYPVTTLPGVAYLDGTIYVINFGGVIYGSGLNNFTSWSALNVITAGAVGNAASAIATQLVSVVAFLEYSIQFFFDNGNATGSPLAVNPSANFQLGCASGRSIVRLDNTLVWMSQSVEHGRGIHCFDGYTPRRLSTPFIERVLDTSNLTVVYARGVRCKGHQYYLITLEDISVTLAYDFTSGEWGVWSSMQADAATIAGTAVLQTDGTVLVTLGSAHGKADGDPVTVSGLAPSSPYNGRFTLSYDSTTMTTSQFSYVPTSTPTITDASGTFQFFTEVPFRGTYHAQTANGDLLLDVSNGLVYVLAPTGTSDYGTSELTLPINVEARLPLFDFGSKAKKRCGRAQLIGDQVDNSYPSLRYSDDDYQTYSSYRRIQMSLDKMVLCGLGQFYRRAFQVKHIDNTTFRALAIELVLRMGTF